MDALNLIHDTQHYSVDRVDIQNGAAPEICKRVCGSPASGVVRIFFLHDVLAGLASIIVEFKELLRGHCSP